MNDIINHSLALYFDTSIDSSIPSLSIASILLTAYSNLYMYILLYNYSGVLSNIF